MRQLDLEKLLDIPLESITRQQIKLIVNGLKETLFDIDVDKRYEASFRDEVKKKIQFYGYYYKHFNDPAIKAMILDLF